MAERFGTPLYVYAAGGLAALYERLSGALEGADALLCYALKANFNLGVVTIFARKGAGADVASSVELRRALQAGIPASRIVFSGVGKRAEELALALDAGILQINVESEAELHLLAEMARDRGVAAPLAFRVNPDIAAGTHDKISTGRAGDKFGIHHSAIPKLYRAAADTPSLAPQGLAIHIGSQIGDATPFREAFKVVSDLAKNIRGAGLPMPRLDLGGGLAAPSPYESEDGEDSETHQTLSMEDYAQMARGVAKDMRVPIILEPGRALTAPAGLLLTTVLHEKEDGSRRRVVIVDAAMNDFMRPALYDARHAILPVRAQPIESVSASRVAGPVCESGDLFSSAAPLPPLKRGDLLAIMEAGAYGAVMASSYNGRPRAAEAMVSSEEAALTRPREREEDLLAHDRLPHWLACP